PDGRAEPHPAGGRPGGGLQLRRGGALPPPGQRGLHPRRGPPPVNDSVLHRHVSEAWEGDIVPTLEAFIRTPTVSVGFGPAAAVRGAGSPGGAGPPTATATPPP